MTTCAQTACDRPTHLRGYCSPHYRRRLHTGRYGYRDAETARARVARLRALGWTYEAIGEAAGVSPWVIHKLDTGVTKRVLVESEQGILTVALVPKESHRGVDATGARRRVQALAWMGWPSWMIADRVGCSRRSLPSQLSRGRVSAKTAHRIADVYEELSTVVGPSKHARGKAVGRGWAPPLAWDDDRIDDRRARPKGVAA